MPKKGVRILRNAANAETLGRRYPLDGLIIAFSFSMAAGRYDQRTNLGEAEANAIGTEYVRAALLPPADAAKLRPLLQAYLDQRIQFHTASWESESGAINTRTAKLQEQLWAAILGPATANPTPVMALVVSGMNDVLSAQGYIQAAWWNRILGSTWGLTIVIAVCKGLVGYGSSLEYDLGICVALASLVVNVRSRI